MGIHLPSIFFSIMGRGDLTKKGIEKSVWERGLECSVVCLDVFFPGLRFSDGNVMCLQMN